MGIMGWIYQVSSFLLVLIGIILTLRGGRLCRRDMTSDPGALDCEDDAELVEVL
jgi:hypothetical protein